jgi:CBS domain-containing protein
VAEDLIFASRLTRLPLLDVDASAIGRIDDIVLLPLEGRPPQLLGLVANVQRRRIFVNANRISGIDRNGVALRFGSVNLRRFNLRRGEVLGSALVSGARVDGALVRDLGLRATRGTAYELAVLVLSPRGGPNPFRRTPVRTVPWTAAGPLLQADPAAGEAAALRELHPSEGARRLRALPFLRRREVAAAMEAENLAQLLEELPENEQVLLIESLDIEQAADVLEAMAPDDAADLLGEMTDDERSELLAAISTDDAASLSRLLQHDEHTAGGLMTPEPVIVTKAATVAESLARLREHGVPPPLATVVFVVEPPVDTPTGTFLGGVGFQQLLREPPSRTVSACLEQQAPVSVPPDLHELAVAERLAEYNLLALAVCDGDGRLLGAVTVDDVLDRTLPADWRTRGR